MLIKVPNEFDRTTFAVLLCNAGCWDNPDSKECSPEPGCVARSPLTHANIRNNTRFCCCRGNLCNVNVTDNVNFTAYEILSRQQAALDASLHSEYWS